MDPALLRERELFKKRALSTPAWVPVRLNIFWWFLNFSPIKFIQDILFSRVEKKKKDESLFVSKDEAKKKPKPPSTTSSNLKYGIHVITSLVVYIIFI